MSLALRAAAALALILAALPGAAFAADSLDRSIVILPIDTSKTAGKLNANDRASLEEMLRDEAIDALQPLGWKVLSGENTIQLLQDNGIDPNACDEGSCHLAVARQMTVPLFVSGAIQYTSDGVYTASFRLYDTKSGDPLASKRIESADLRGLREQFHKLAADFYSRAPAYKSAQAGTAGPSSEAHLGGEAKALELSDHEAIVSFDPTPAGAVVLVDGAVLCQSTPCKKSLALGSHAVSIQKDGYEPAELTLVAKAGAAVAPSLSRISARVAVETTPPGLRVSIDGRDAGLSPISAADLPAGPHEVLVDDSCFVREGERAVLKKGEDRTIRIQPKPRMAGLAVSAEDAAGNAVEARVLVDGQDLGATPGSFKVSACAKTLELRAGELGSSEPLSLSEGQVQQVHLKLQQRMGTLKITTSRSAECQIGAQRFSVSSGDEGTLQLPIGTVQLSCSAENPDGTRASTNTSATVSATGSSTRIELGAEPPAPPGFWSNRKLLRGGLTLGINLADFVADGKFSPSIGVGAQLQLEGDLLEFFVVQIGGFGYEISDSSGNSSSITDGTGMVGIRPLTGSVQPWAAVRYSSWGASAQGTALEGGLRLVSDNFGVDFVIDYGLAGPAQVFGTISLVWLTSR